VKSENERIKKNLEILKKHLEEKSSKFFKVDLHVHTLNSFDVKSKLSVEEYAEELMKKASNEKLNIIAITDHNCIKDFNVFKDKAEKYGILALAGAEINVPKSHVESIQHPYVHVIAIHEDESMINSILHTLYIEENSDPKTAFAKTNPLGLFEVIRIINEKEGIAILAHSSGHKGFGNEFRDSYRVAIVEKIKDLPFFVEIRDEDDTKFFDGTDEGLNFLYRPCLFGSDCHTIDDDSDDERKIGTRFSYLKMQNPTFENLKKVLREPKLRVIRRNPPVNPSQRILGVYVSGGYFEGELFAFHPNLNVLIGGRGAGKSTLVNLIQFAFNDLPLTEIGRQEYESKIKNLLSDGNSVYVYFYGNDGNLYIIKRTYMENILEKKHTDLFYIHNGNIVRDEIEKLESLIETEIYCQGELVEIAKKDEDQLKLIDDYIVDKRLFQLRQKECEYISGKIQDIMKIQEEIETLEEEIDKQYDLTKRISELSNLVKFDFVRNYQEWQKEYKYIQSTNKFLEDISNAVYNAPFPKIPNLESSSVLNSDLINQITLNSKELINHLYERTRSVINESISVKFHEEIRDLISKWQVKYDEVENEYKSKLDEKDHDVGAIVENLNKKKEKLDEINNSIIPIFKQRKEEIEKIEKGILTNVKTIIKLDSEIQKKRMETASYISDNLSNVKIEFSTERMLGYIVEKLINKFTGHEYKFRNKEDKFPNILKSFNHPLELLESLSSTVKYSKLLEESSDQKIYAAFHSKRTDEGFVQALIQPAPFYPKIQLLKESQYEILEELSLGEKCGTILSIILLQKSNPRVLIIDTPESEMDHRFFINQVVDAISKSKYHTQQIFVTHNPNIPVLADSELIHEIKAMGNKKGKISQSGYLDCDETLKSVVSLEGGEEAFRSRSRRYGFSLN